MVLFTPLRLFRDIAQTGNLSRAAERHGVTTSAASQQLNEWEKLLGAKLLDRSTRPLTLTPAGLVFLNFCESSLEQVDTLQHQLAQLRKDSAEVVKVASIYSVGLSEMSRLEAAFLKAQPQARLQVEYLRPEHVYTSVLREQADLGIVSYPEARRDLAVLPWRQEEMVVAVAPGHPLAGEESVQPRQLNGQPFISFDQDLPIRRDIDRFLAEHRVSVHQVMHFDNLGMIKEAVALGSGISLVPERILGTEIEDGRIVALPLAGASFYRPLGIVYRRKKKWRPAAAAFLRLLQEQSPSTTAPDRFRSDRN